MRAHNGRSPNRTRVATLMPGEHVWVTGQLELGVDPEQMRSARHDAYRDPATAWILRGGPTVTYGVQRTLSLGTARRAAKSLTKAAAGSCRDPLEEDQSERSDSTSTRATCDACALSSESRITEARPSGRVGPTVIAS